MHEVVDSFVDQSSRVRWKEERGKVFRRAETVYHRINELIGNAEFMQRMLKSAQDWYSEDPEGRAVAREITALFYDELGPMTAPDELDVWLVHGLAAGAEHAWLVVEGSPALVHPDGMLSTRSDEVQRALEEAAGDTSLDEAARKKYEHLAAKPRACISPEDVSKGSPFGAWRYVIDCHALELLPSVILLSPYSPYHSFYYEQERFRVHPEPPLRPQYQDSMSADRRLMLEELKSRLLKAQAVPEQ